MNIIIRVLEDARRRVILWGRFMEDLDVSLRDIAKEFGENEAVISSGTMEFISPGGEPLEAMIFFDPDHNNMSIVPDDLKTFNFRIQEGVRKCLDKHNIKGIDIDVWTLPIPGTCFTSTKEQSLEVVAQWLSEHEINFKPKQKT